MKRSKLTGRVIRLLALTALVATPVVVFTTAGSAGAAEVSDQDALREAFEDDLVSEIILTGDITIDPSGDEGCDEMRRDSDVSLVIEGQGFTITKDEAACDDDGQEGERIFRQRGNGTITFQNVTVTGGVKIGGEGGALKTDGPVVVTNSVFSNNQALRCDDKAYDESVSDPEAEGYCGDAYGGAIFAEGSVTISFSEFSNNHADEGGGGVFTESNIVVESSVFNNNSATSEFECWCSGGGWLALGGSDVNGSDISDNQAGCEAYCGGSGGGFWSAGPASVVATTLSNNSAGCEFACEGVGGGFSAAGYGQDSMAAQAIGGLGAAAADPGQILVSNATFVGNVAACGIDDGFNLDGAGGGYACGSGGGFYAYAADLVSVAQSTFTGNQALCVIEVEDVEAAGRSEICGFGGGIFTQYVDETIVDSSTFNENFASLAGGAISTGALFIETGLCEGGEGCGGQDLQMVNNTVTANTSGIFGAINALGSEDDRVALVHNTIVGNVLDISDLLFLPLAEDPELGANISAFSMKAFGNIVVQGTGVGELADVTGNCLVEAVDSEGYNFSDDETCGFDNSTDNVQTPNDPELQPLGAYGGPTNTMRPEGEIQGTTLVSLSPVVDQIPADDCVLDIDQRGVSRPQTVIEDACDIGSVEITAEEITISPDVVVTPLPVPLQPKFTG